MLTGHLECVLQADVLYVIGHLLTVHTHCLSHFVASQQSLCQLGSQWISMLTYKVWRHLPILDNSTVLISIIKQWLEMHRSESRQAPVWPEL